MIGNHRLAACRINVKFILSLSKGNKKILPANTAEQMYGESTLKVLIKFLKKLSTPGP